MGRLDHLVEAVFERFKDRYFKDESTHYLPCLLLGLGFSDVRELFRSLGRLIWHQVRHQRSCLPV